MALKETVAKYGSLIPAQIGFTNKMKFEYGYQKPFGIYLTLWIIYVQLGWIADKVVENE